MEKKPDFKAMPTKKKIGYVWDYYRWHIIAAICTAAFLISTIIHFVTYRDPLLNVIMINCSAPYNTEHSGFDEFMSSRGYDTDPALISVISNLYFSDDAEPMSAMQQYQVLSTLIGAGGQDLFFGTGAAFNAYADQGALLDLSTVLPEDLLARYADSLIYSTDDGTVDAYPCAIGLSGHPWLKDNNYYYGPCSFGIFAAAANPGTAAEFVRFLLEYPAESGH